MYGITFQILHRALRFPARFPNAEDRQAGYIQLPQHRSQIYKPPYNYVQHTFETISLSDNQMDQQIKKNRNIRINDDLSMRTKKLESHRDPRIHQPI